MRPFDIAWTLLKNDFANEKRDWEYGQVPGWGFNPINVNAKNNARRGMEKVNVTPMSKNPSSTVSMKACERCGEKEFADSMVEDSFCRRCARELTG